MDSNSISQNLVTYAAGKNVTQCLSASLHSDWAIPLGQQRSMEFDHIDVCSNCIHDGMDSDFLPLAAICSKYELRNTSTGDYQEG